VTTSPYRTKSVRTTVTDTNGRPAGERDVRVTFFAGTPNEVEHRARVYRATGKQGTNVRTGRDVVELATEKDERVWLTLDGTALYED
jgi:hypothetical protein